MESSFSTNPDGTLKSNGKFCDFDFLIHTCGTNTDFIKKILDDFLKQIPEELAMLNKAVNTKDFETIKRICHKMKSTVAIIRISDMVSILAELETLASQENEIEKMNELFNTLIKFQHPVLLEIETKKTNL